MRTQKGSVAAPPMTLGLVLAFHRVVNRPIYDDERRAIGGIFTGRATSGEARFFWQTAQLAYFCLIPVGLLAALALSEVADPLALAALVAPFVGGLYSSVVKASTRDARARFKPSTRYFLHDAFILMLIAVTATVIAVIS